jgi:hypothetical protein
MSSQRQKLYFAAFERLFTLIRIFFFLDFEMTCLTVADRGNAKG